MGSTYAHHYPHTKFHQWNRELWIFDFFVISQSEQICKWGIKYAHSVTTDHIGSTCVPHYPHTKFDKNRSLCSHLRAKVYLLMLTRSDWHLYIHTYRQRYKWKLSGPSSIAGGPHQSKTKHTHKKTLIKRRESWIWEPQRVFNLLRRGVVCSSVAQWLKCTPSQNWACFVHKKYAQFWFWVQFPQA